MDDQKILDILADAESDLFYAKNARPTDELKAAHEAVRAALLAFAKETGYLE